MRILSYTLPHTNPSNPMESNRQITCPKCQAPMESVVFRSVEIDRCTQCKGLWFDAAEKEELKAYAGSEAIDVGDERLGKQYNEVDRIDCPVCHTQMIRMVDMEQPHIWYESCPVCYGTFFDAGEFRDYKDESFSDFFRKLLSRERS